MDREELRRLLARLGLGSNDPGTAAAAIWTRSITLREAIEYIEARYPGDHVGADHRAARRQVRDEAATDDADPGTHPRTGLPIEPGQDV